MFEYNTLSILLSNECELFLSQNRLMHKIKTHNEEIMINKVAPPTDPAIMGMVDPPLEVFKLDASV